MNNGIIKPTVMFDKGNFSVEKGYRALIKPLNHPSALVSNLGLALTSTVIDVQHDASGKLIGFETENTVYKLA